MRVIILLLLLIPVLSFGQDTMKQSLLSGGLGDNRFEAKKPVKADTVRIPVYYIDVTDTADIVIIYWKDKQKGNLKSMPVKVIERGFTNNGQWVDRSRNSFTLLNRKWKPIPKKILNNIYQTTTLKK